ncbi:hypothetical protein HYPSUDRAFT_134699, partial [Hypholoma sublateritium FD-334 SS-4]
FATWAPNVYRHYKGHMDSLFEKMPHLRRIFGRKCVFACVAFNFGPRVCTASHRDQLNLPYGWCGIFAIGSFDSKLGGHLVLDDLKKIIEFPAGSLILIPSATLTHRNTPVQAYETRLSFTLFSAGGLFRFVDNGFQTEKDLRKKNPNQYTKMMAEKKVRWRVGCSLWSKLDDLVEAVSQDR